jgi:hypothetical protein
VGAVPPAPLALAPGTPRAVTRLDGLPDSPEHDEQEPEERDRKQDHAPKVAARGHHRGTPRRETDARKLIGGPANYVRGPCALLAVVRCFYARAGAGFFSWSLRACSSAAAVDLGTCTTTTGQGA